MKINNFTKLLRVVIIFVSLGAFINNAQAQPCLCDLDITASSSTVAPGGPSSSINTTGSTSGTSWTWYRDANNLQTCNCPTYNATKPGEYIVKANACDEVSSLVEVLSTLPGTYSTGSVLNSINPSGGTINNQVYYITSDVAFTALSGAGNPSFSNCTFIFANDVKLTIPTGNSFNGNPMGATFTNCGFYGYQGTEWKGVKVAAGAGNQVTFDGCHFREASFAIFQDGERDLSIEECEFGKNGTHVALENVSSSSTVSIYLNQFGDLWPDVDASDADFPYSLSPSEFKQIYLYTCGGFDLITNFYAETKIEEAAYDVYGVYFEDCDDIEVRSSLMDGRLTNGVRYEDGNAATTKVTTTSTAFNTEPRYWQISSIACDLKIFKIETAIYSYNSGDIDITSNNINDCLYGVELYSGNGTNTSYVHKNYFDGNEYGLVMASHVNPLPNTTGNNAATTQNVTFYCNSFINHTKCGVAGYGTIIQQGASGMGAGADASNKFSGNTEWNILIDHVSGVGTIMDYHYNGPGTGGDYVYPPTTPLPLVVNGMNVTLYGNTSPTSTVNRVISDENASTSCYPTLKKGWNTTSVDDVTTNEDLYTAYPNPFNTQVNINLPNGTSANYIISITNISGKAMIVYDTQGADIYTINTSNLASGMYLIQVYDENNNLLHRQKLVKAQ